MNCLTGQITGTIASDAAAGSPYTVHVTLADASPGAQEFDSKWVDTTFTWTVGSGNEIAFRSSSSSSVGSSRAVTVPLPPGIQQGDGLLAAITVSGAPNSVTPPSGWKLVRLERSGSALRQYVYGRFAGASEPSSYTWKFPARFAVSAAIVGYSGVSTATPLDVMGARVNASSASITAPSVTAAASGEVLVGFFGTATNASIGPDPAMLERAEVHAVGTLKSNSLEVADDLLDAAGATQNRIATASKAAVNIGQVIVLRPAP